MLIVQGRQVIEVDTAEPGQRVLSTAAELALVELVITINNTGGLDRDTNAPAVDTEWVDLGLAYLQACEVLEIDPLYEDEIEYEDDE